MVENVDCAVIGAGVIGLAVARALASAGREVVVLEAAGAIGTGISSRNSEVIHAGMYYPTGSLKARFCVDGNKLLRRYLSDHQIAHRMTGKLIVATEPDEQKHLEKIYRQGEINGVEGLSFLDGTQARALEPAVRCTSAVFSTATGIVDTHGYMLALLGDIEGHDGAVALNSPVVSGEVTDRGVLLSVGGTEPCRLLCRSLVNAAGLAAQSVAAAIAGVPQDSVPPLHLCKGNYFVLSGRMPFSRLIYPVPQQAGLGIHFTLDLAGQGRFGPDVEWIETENYQVSACRGDSFVAGIRRYWPGLADGTLHPGYAGIRPKLGPAEAPAEDFRVVGPADHGVAGLVNLFGIESPGITASLAIAEHVAEMLR